MHTCSVVDSPLILVHLAFRTCHSNANTWAVHAATARGRMDGSQEQPFPFPCHLASRCPRCKDACFGCQVIHAPFHRIWVQCTVVFQYPPRPYLIPQVIHQVHLGGGMCHVGSPSVMEATWIRRGAPRPGRRLLDAQKARRSLQERSVAADPSTCRFRRASRPSCACSRPTFPFVSFASLSNATSIPFKGFQ